MPFKFLQVTYHDYTTNPTLIMIKDVPAKIYYLNTNFNTIDNSGYSSYLLEMCTNDNQQFLTGCQGIKGEADMRYSGTYSYNAPPFIFVDKNEDIVLTTDFANNLEYVRCFNIDSMV